MSAAHLLRELGHDVLTARDAGNANQGIADPLVLSYAIEHRRAVLTLNKKDFARFHRQSAAHCGILLCSDMDPEDLAERIHKAVVKQGCLDGQLLRILRPG